MQLPVPTTAGLRRATLFTSMALGLAIVLALFEATQVTLVEAGHNDHTWWFRFTHVLLPWCLAALFAPAMHALVRRFPLSRRSIKHWLFHAVAAVALSLAHLSLLAQVHVRFGMIDTTALTWTRVLISSYVFQDILVYWAVCGTLHAIALLDESRRREIARLQLQHSLARAQFHALQAQIRPHFLFNTLNSVASLARTGDNESVVTMLARLGELLRRLLKETPDHEVRLDEEVAFVRQYVAIEMLRFDGGIRFEVALEDSTADALVPNFILQPLVENSLRHGFGARTGDAVLRISAKHLGGMLSVHVTDNGVGMTKARHTGHGLGLRLTADRLRAAHGERASLRAAPAVPAGTRVTITLPYRAAPVEAPSIEALAVG